MTGQEAATRWTESFVHDNVAVLTRLKITADVAHQKVLKELGNSTNMEILDFCHDDFLFKKTSLTGTLLEERPDIARAVKKRYASRKIIQFMRKDLQALQMRSLLDEKAAAILQNVGVIVICNKRERQIDCSKAYRYTYYRISQIVAVRYATSI